MKSMTALIIVAAAVFALGTPCQGGIRVHRRPTAGEHVAATDLGDGAEFKGKEIQMKDKGEVAYLMFFKAGQDFEATTDGPKNTDVNLFVYDDAGKEVGKDVSPGPKCSVKVTPAKDGKYKFVITNAGGDNAVIFKVKSFS